MPGSGPHRFEFIGEEPLIFRVLVVLLFVVVFLGLALDFGAKYLLPKAAAGLQVCKALSDEGVQRYAPAIVCWYADEWIWIDFFLLAAIVLTMVVFRKRVRYVYRGRREK